MPTDFVGLERTQLPNYEKKKLDAFSAAPKPIGFVGVGSSKSVCM